MSVIAGMARLKVRSAGSKGVVVVFNFCVRGLNRSDKRHSKNVFTKLMQLKTNISIVGSFLCEVFLSNLTNGKFSRTIRIPGVGSGHLSGR
jgi:hypothetical protein